MAKHFAHVLFLGAELCGLLLLIIYQAFLLLERDVLWHQGMALPCLMLSIGLGLISVMSISQIGVLRLADDLVRKKSLLVMHCVGGVIGGIMIVFGIITCSQRYPALFRIGELTPPCMRMSKFGAIKVTFDAQGGVVDDRVRVVSRDGRYGVNMNLYPSEDERYFSKLDRVRLNLAENMFLVDFNNGYSGDVCLSYFSMNAVPIIDMQEKWTYIADVTEFKGQIKYWCIGQSWTTNSGCYASFVGTSFKMDKAGRVFRCLSGTNWPIRNLLDRGAILMEPGQMVKMKFRISLFAGTGINESNYHYVRPGETLACPLPVPTREGYAFEGWYDGDRRITEESKVERRETHTLKAHWRKL